MFQCELFYPLYHQTFDFEAISTNKQVTDNVLTIQPSALFRKHFQSLKFDNPAIVIELLQRGKSYVWVDQCQDYITSLQKRHHFHYPNSEAKRDEFTDSSGDHDYDEDNDVLISKITKYPSYDNVCKMEDFKDFIPIYYDDSTTENSFLIAINLSPH